MIVINESKFNILGKRKIDGKQKRSSTVAITFLKIIYIIFMIHYRDLRNYIVKLHA